MEKTIKINFPHGCGKGYVFAGFKVKMRAEEAVEFLKQQGDFLCLNEECKVKPKCKRKTELLILDKEVVIKLQYKFYDAYWYIDAAKADTKGLLEQIENLLEYAEKQKGGA